MDTVASQITSLTIVYSTVYSDTDQRKHQSSTPLAFVRGIHREPVDSPHKRPVTRQMFPFDDVIMYRPWPRFGWRTFIVEQLTTLEMSWIETDKSRWDMYIPNLYNWKLRNWLKCSSWFMPKQKVFQAIIIPISKIAVVKESVVKLFSSTMKNDIPKRTSLCWALCRFYVDSCSCGLHILRVNRTL